MGQHDKLKDLSELTELESRYGYPAVADILFLWLVKAVCCRGRCLPTVHNINLKS